MKKILIIILLVLMSACSFNYEIKNSDEDIAIIITSDLHYIDPSLSQGETFKSAQELSDGKLSIYIDKLLDAFIKETVKRDPDIVIINGDLTYNGEKLSHESLAKALAEFKKNDIQALVIPGNHDILNAHAYDYSHDDAIYYTDYITAQDFREIYKDFGFTNAKSYDEASLSYLFEAGEDLWLFMLDSNTYEENTNFAPSSIGCIREETLTWMSELLDKKAEDTTVLVFMHHPLLNLGGSSSYVLENDDEFKEIVDKYRLPLVISGHIHAQNVKEEKSDHVTFKNLGISSLAVYDHQYTELVYHPAKTIDVTTHDLDMETYAQNEGITDPFFKDFRKNAYDYFKKYSTTRLVGSYSGEDISEVLSAKLLDLKGTFNCLLFSGEGYKLRTVLESDPDYEEIQKYRESYALSFFRDLSVFANDSTKLHIDIETMIK